MSGGKTTLTMYRNAVAMALPALAEAMVSHGTLMKCPDFTNHWFYQGNTPDSDLFNSNSYMCEHHRAWLLHTVGICPLSRSLLPLDSNELLLLQFDTDNAGEFITYIAPGLSFEGGLGWRMERNPRRRNTPQIQADVSWYDRRFAIGSLREHEIFLTCTGAPSTVHGVAPAMPLTDMVASLIRQKIISSAAVKDWDDSPGSNVLRDNLTGAVVGMVTFSRGLDCAIAKPLADLIVSMNPKFKFER